MERLLRSKRLARGKSSKRKVASPQDIEKGIKSIKTVTWDPFTVLPKEVFLEIFDKLDSSSDKQNFMNANMKWYDLFKQDRTLFLFQQVFKEVAKMDEDEDIDWNPWVEDKKREFENYKHCRFVCRDWDFGFQSYFQLHDNYFKLGSEKNFLGIEQCEEYNEPCKSFTWYTAKEAEKDLEGFSLTHPPSRNPFLSRGVTLMPFFDQEAWMDGLDEEDLDVGRYRKSIDAILDKYGRHIWHCKVEIHDTLNIEGILVIAKWLDLMPELKTLLIDCRGMDGFLSKEELKEIEDVQIVQPELKKLVFRKSTDLPAILCNKLFGNLNGLEKVRVKFTDGKEALRNFEMSGGANLKEAFFAINGLEDFKYLEASEGFPRLKKLVTLLEFETFDEDLKKYVKGKIWPAWRLTFKVLEEKFPALEDLTLMLPKAISEEDKMAAIDQSLEYQLNLPNLKKLWVGLPDLCSIDFLRPCKALEKLMVVFDHPDCGPKMSRALRRIRRNEKINLNKDFRTMWESNIWEAFPKLKKLKILAMYEGESWKESGIDRFVYEKDEGKKEYYQWTNAERQAVNSRCRKLNDMNIYSDSD